jgi:hypothetical protein
MVDQPCFFGLSDRYAVLSAAGDPLACLAALVDFEVFRVQLIAALRRSPRGRGGRPPFDPVDDVQDPGAAGALLAVGRSERVPDQGPAPLPVVPGARRIRPIARRRTKSSLSGACSRATSTSGACRVGRCPSTLPELISGVPLCAQRSSTCSLDRSTAWSCSSAPSASPGPGPRSAWPTSPITSSASPSSRGEVRPHARKRVAEQHSSPKTQGNDAESPTLTRQSPQSDPSRRRQAENSRFFEASNFLAATRSANC